MADIVDKLTRSKMMAGIRGKDTKPEIAIRKSLFREGFRYRIHYKRLPGKPDLVFPKYKAIILINGCFWHRHNCHLFKWPSTRPDFWKRKINANVARDKKNFVHYESLGWKVMIVWECAIKGRTRLSVDEVVNTIINWLQFDPHSAEITGR